MIESCGEGPARRIGLAGSEQVQGVQVNCARRDCCNLNKLNQHPQQGTGGKENCHVPPEYDAVAQPHVDGRAREVGAEHHPDTPRHASDSCPTIQCVRRLILRPEIDHNFSKAHRIVTSSIIPIVEQYAKHSDAVWEGSKFWKQFFEASANVSLSSYEEAPEEDLTALGQEQGDSHRGTPSQVEVDDTLTTSEDEPTARFNADVEASSILDSPSVTVRYQGTPRRQQDPRASGKSKSSRTEETSFAEYTSPYENLKQEMAQGQPPQKAPETPGPEIEIVYGDSSPAPSPPTTARNPRRANADPLLHRVLDKNYRVQATPRTAQKTAGRSNVPSAHTRTQTTLNPMLDSSPFSPAPVAPQLRSEIFGSPKNPGPRTPGVSVQKSIRRQRTPGVPSARKTLFPQSQSHANTQAQPPKTPAENLWSSDDEDNLYPQGMSPPKTMQFHIPQSRLMQTPAREASKRIVEDLLMSAGVPDSVTSEMGGLDLEGDHEGWNAAHEAEDGSPSIIRGRPRESADDDF